MQALNNGTLDANRPLTKEEADMVNTITGTDAAKEGESEVDFEEYYENDMEDVIDKVLDYLVPRGVLLNGSIEYCGGYSPTDSVIYVNGDYCYTEEKQTISETSDEELRQEYISRFGTLYVATVGGDFVRRNETLNNDGCESTEDALRKAWNTPDAFGEDPKIEILVCHVRAQSAEEALRKAEEKAPYYKHLMTVRAAQE